jgi:hypothetical protein
MWYEDKRRRHLRASNRNRSRPRPFPHDDVLRISPPPPRCVHPDLHAGRPCPPHDPARIPRRPNDPLLLLVEIRVCVLVSPPGRRSSSNERGREGAEGQARSEPRWVQGGGTRRLWSVSHALSLSDGCHWMLMPSGGCRWVWDVLFYQHLPRELQGAVDYQAAQGCE